MQASFYSIVHNGFFMNFSIHGSSAWWSRMRMVHMTAVDIQVSLRNPTAMLEDSMMSVKTLYALMSMGLLPYYHYEDHHMNMWQLLHIYISTKLLSPEHPKHVDFIWRYPLMTLWLYVY